MFQGVADPTVVIVKRHAEDDTGDRDRGENVTKTGEKPKGEGLDILTDEEP